MNKYNTELNKITKVLNDFNINEIGKTSRFCSRKRIIKPFELVMSLITALGDKSINTVTDLHRYFVKLTAPSRIITLTPANLKTCKM